MFSKLRIFCRHIHSNFCILFLLSALSLTTAISLVPGTACTAEDISDNASAMTPLKEERFPSEYGRVIYQKNADSLHQIYIIGQSHRSAITGRNSQDIIQVQAEIFRIGEWLIQEKNVGMLLPEGFFQKVSPDRRPASTNVIRQSVRLDNQTLEARLGDSQFVNADMLLNTSYNIPLGQVENEKLYRNIRQLLRKANKESNLSILSRIQRLQDERTAVMLQNIPDIVEEAFAEGRIDNRRAMFTIGLGHVPEIISFLQHGSVRRSGEQQPNEGEKMGEASLKLLKRGYGVTVIIPRTLAENEHLLRLARLETE
jgi:hypothetical protein